MYQRIPLKFDYLSKVNTISLFSNNIPWSQIISISGNLLIIKKKCMISVGSQDIDIVMHN